MISVHDICLDSEGPANAQLTFADIYSIQVSVADKVTSILFRCLLVDHDKHDSRLI